MGRRIRLVVHPAREDLVLHTCALIGHFAESGIEVALPPEEVARYAGEPNVVADDPEDPATGCELVLILGGDGTILRGAELARHADIPLLGINFGHVGFLAEAEREDLAAVVEAVALGRYAVEERLTLDIRVRVGDTVIQDCWALNEVAIEKAARERMLEVIVEIDGRPLSTWGTDGVIVATPTGSTAYAFSAGGPVVWPGVEAMLVVPISAHALFARPMVVGPDSRIAVELMPGQLGRGVLWCDGARWVDLPEASRVEVTRSRTPVRLARLGAEPFTDRLVAKFNLSVDGWRGRPAG